MTQVVAVGILSVVLLVALACTQAPTASTPQDFYKGKTIIWGTASEAGGGADTMARSVAPYLEKELGITVKVENMGSEEGLNIVYNESKRDGLTLITKSTSAVLSNDILKAPGTQYEADKFNYLADLHPTAKVLELSPKLPHKTIEALRQAKGLKAGATSVKGDLAVSGSVVIELLGLDAKVISGYKGTKDLKLASARGEIDFQVTSDTSAAQDEADGNVVNFVVIGDNRSTALPNVPTLAELGVKVPSELAAARDYISIGGYALALPPDVPADRVEYLRKALLKIQDDKNLQNDVAKVAGTWSPFMPGKELQDKMTSVKANKALADQLDTIFKKYQTVQ